MPTPPQPKTPALILARDPTLSEHLPEYVFHPLTELRGSVKFAADLRPAFLLVNMDDDSSDWENITTALKTNNATRRIPQIGIANTPTDFNDRGQFDAIIARDDLPGKLVEAIEHLARLWDETYYAEMRSACDKDLPDMARKGIDLFNVGEYWEAHEALESAWVTESRPVRDLYRAILQVGVAYYQIERGNYRGAIKMFLRAVQWLDPLPDACQRIDIARLKKDAAAARAALEALTPETISEFDPSLLKPIKVIREPFRKNDV